MYLSKLLRIWQTLSAKSRNSFRHRYFNLRSAWVSRPRHAAEGILQTAEEIGCDLIVMGTKGRTGLSRLLMGSVAEHVLAKADCPVLVAKAGHSAPASFSRELAEDVVTV